MADFDDLVRQFKDQVSQQQGKVISVGKPSEDRMTFEVLNGMIRWHEMQRFLFNFALTVIGLEVFLVHLILILVVFGGTEIRWGYFQFITPNIEVDKEIVIALIVSVYGQVLLTLRSLIGKIFLQFKRADS